MKSRISWSEVTSLEEKVKFWILERDSEIQRISSELQVSANPPIQSDLKDEEFNRQLADSECLLQWRKRKLPFRVIFALACQSWFYPEELRTTVQFLILEERKRWNYCHPELDLVLSHKAQCILYLQNQVHRKGWSWLFGSIFTEKWTVRNKDGEYINFHLWEVFPKYYWRKKSKPKKTGRIRGYRDHGSLGDQGTRIRREELQKDFTTRQEEERIEQMKRKHWSVTEILRGWFS